jgi:phosphoadenosine phosphosulfate reductase
MYAYEWDNEIRGFRLLAQPTLLEKEIRPVFYEELDLFGLDQFWSYPRVKEPLLWAEGVRRYFYRGECIAEARGGGFYSRPTFINPKHGGLLEPGLRILPVNVEEMVERNREIIDGLAQKSISFIQETYSKYEKKKVDEFIVAFSGGKDSLVLLDLVQRALPPNYFKVIFSDTGMELSSTYEAVQRAKERWANLHFIDDVRSHLSPEKSWEEFGPPARKQRWCCSVHKSVPTLLKLRELSGKNAMKVLVFDGIRHAESKDRDKYESITEGGKHTNQINVSPIINWNTAELYLYMFDRNLLLNDAYRYGVARVGCAVCPMASRWWDFIANNIYNKDLETLLGKVIEYAYSVGIPKNEIKQYVTEGGWKGRVGGRGLINAGNRVVETADNDTIIFSIASSRQDWLECAKALGPIIRHSDTEGEQKINSHFYPFKISKKVSGGIRVEYGHYRNMDRYVVSFLRSVANKVAYCLGCKACVVECPLGAFQINDDRIMIGSSCNHCFTCLKHVDKGCLAAKSLAVTVGGTGMNLKGMNRYQHFGLRQQWLQHYFQLKDECWDSGELGNRQYDALRVWLREAGIRETKKDGSKTITALGEKLLKLGANNQLTWAVIWTNLAYNSIIVRWYVLNTQWGQQYTKEDLIHMLGDDYAKSTRENAVTSLVELLRYSPLGGSLGFGHIEYVSPASKVVKRITKVGWAEADPLAVLYSFYVYAEKMKGHYNFTFSELLNRAGDVEGLDPMTLFGVDKDEIIRIIKGLSISYPQFIKCDFVKDLDNIYLSNIHSSDEVIELA